MRIIVKKFPAGFPGSEEGASDKGRVTKERPQGWVKGNRLCLEMKYPKSEKSNPKSETIINDQNSNDPNKKHTWHRDDDFVFLIWSFGI